MSESIITTRRVPTWENLGHNVIGSHTVQEVMESAGLNYEVSLEPVYVNDPQGGIHPLPGRLVTTRNSDGHAYDVVSDKYQVVQNHEAFDFVNYMGQDVSFVKAGETASGMVYIIAQLDSVSILGDTFTPYVIFRNGFNGKINIAAAICPLRIVCQNQFRTALKNANNAVIIRHVGNAESKLKEARNVLQESASYMVELNAAAERLAVHRLTPGSVDRVLDTLFPVVEGMNPFSRKLAEDRRAAFAMAYTADDNANFRGSAWGMVNAYSDFLTHMAPAGKTPTRFEGKFITSTFGSTIGMDRVVGLVMAA